jgi:hypothetical protein
MHQQQFTHHSSLSGRAYGFAINSDFSSRILVHGGGARGFTALLWLVPEQDFGVFVACNLPDASLQDALFTSFNQRFLSSSDTTQTHVGSGASSMNASALTGYYRNIYHSRTTFEKIMALTSHVHVVTTDDGLVAKGLASTPVRLRPLGKGRFRYSNRNKVVFDELEDGTASLIYSDAPEAPTYERVSVWESPMAHGVMAGGLVLIFIVSVFDAVTRWWYGTQTLSHEHWTAAGIATAYLSFFIGFPLAFLEGPRGNMLAFFYGPSMELVAALGLPVIALAATVYLAMRVLWKWKHGIGSVRQRIGLMVLILASLACGLLLHYWNVLGWQF